MTPTREQVALELIARNQPNPPRDRIAEDTDRALAIILRAMHQELES